VVAAGRQNRGQRGARHGLWPAVHGALLETHPVSQRRPRRDRCLVSDGEVMGMIWVKHQQYTYIYIPVVPHKAVAEVSKIGNL
jgi:hypothetical protein